MTETPSFNEAIISEVRIALARRKLNQADLAKMCGWVPQYLSRRMTGEIAFTTEEIEKIAFILNMSVFELTNPAQPRTAS